MMRMLIGVAGSLGLVLAVAGAGAAEPAGFVSTHALRGYGAVTAAFGASEDGRVSVATFTAENPGKAARIAGKFLADLHRSPEVRRERLKHGGGDVPVFVTAGGQAFFVGLRGNVCQVFGAERAAELAAALGRWPVLPVDAVEGGDYPAYLDRFRWGMNGFGGFENKHAWMQFHGMDRSVKDPREDMEFLKDMDRMPFGVWLDPSGFDTGDGLIRAQGQRWKIKLAVENGLLNNMIFYIPSGGGGDWLPRRFPEYLDQPAKFLQSGWHHPSMFFRNYRHISWYAKPIRGYLGLQARKMMRAVQNPQLGDYMLPYSELLHNLWFDMHADYSPTAAASWRDFLRNHGVTPETAGALYRRAHAPFQSLDQIPVPEFATFAGLPGLVQDLSGLWFYKVEQTAAPAGGDFYQRPPEERYPGLREKWYAPDAPLDDWQTLSMPGDPRMYTLYDGQMGGAEASAFFRRTFDYDPVAADGKPVYLYFFPMSRDLIHMGPTRRYHALFLNGEKVGEIGTWGALDVTRWLRVGGNQLAIQLHGGLWDGRIFLSTDAPRVYPYLGPDGNRLWNLWNDWRKGAKYDAWRELLDAMRAEDPDRPVKFAAPLYFGDLWRRLALDYGGFPHFTGEGMWFFPWYKRYARLYGLPASSETGSPLFKLDDVVADFRRVFLAGLDAHEPVFHTQAYSRSGEIRAWYRAHKEILGRLGTYEIDGPQVLLYRVSDNLSSTFAPYPPVGASMRALKNPYHWDLGRGTFQALGVSCLYIENDGLRDGKAFGYPVILDTGNETITPEALAALKEYVAAGGTFVALPFTGRHTPDAADSWPIAELSGCTGYGERPLGGRVTVAPDQTLLAASAGKTFADNGRAIYLDNFNTHSVELEPGPDARVIATYENGRPAIVERPYGRGRVITLGTAYWRDAYDDKGIWWSGEGEEAFVADLLSGVGFPPAACRVDDRRIWAQPYRSNNGLETVSVLVNWHEEGVQTPAVAWRLPRAPGRIVAYGPGRREVPFRWEDGAAVFQLEIPAREVVLLAAETFTPTEAVPHWWTRQTELWRGAQPAPVELSAYTVGKWVDPTLDLSDDARFTNDAPPADWAAPAFDDAGWTPAPLEILNFWGARDGAPVWVRKRFRVDPAWLASGTVRLVSGNFSGPHYANPTRALVNGREVHPASTADFLDLDIGRFLVPGDNVLAFEIAGGEKYTGFIGNVYLYHRAPALRSLDLAGSWDGLDADGRRVTVAFPGRHKVGHPGRTVYVPEEWRGRYQVRFQATGAPYSILGVWVNGQLVRRHHHHKGRYCDIDITDALRFGVDNRLELAFGSEYNGWAFRELHTFEIDSLGLDLFPVATP